MQVKGRVNRIVVPFRLKTPENKQNVSESVSVVKATSEGNNRPNKHAGQQ